MLAVRLVPAGLLVALLGSLLADAVFWSVARRAPARVVEQTRDPITWELTLVLDYERPRLFRTPLPERTTVHVPRWSADKLGDIKEVTVLDLGPYHRADLPRGEELAAAWMAALMYGVFAWWALRHLLSRPFGQLWLVVTGRAAPGRVVDKLPGVVRRLAYEFTDEADPDAPARVAMARVDKQMFDAVDRGESVTVLHSLWNPRWACAYEHTLYLAAPSPEAPRLQSTHGRRKPSS